MPAVDNAAVLAQLERVERVLSRQAKLLACLFSLVEILMGTKDELQAEIDSLKQAVIDDQAGDQAVVDSQNATIAQMQTKINELELGTDFQPFIDQLKATHALIVPVSGETPVPTA